LSFPYSGPRFFAQCDPISDLKVDPGLGLHDSDGVVGYVIYHSFS